MLGLLTTICLAACLWAYFNFVADLLPGGFPGGFLLHLFGAPAVLGVAAYLILRRSPGRVLWLVWLPFLVPIATIVVMEGDPAKPGLQWYFYPPLLLGIYLGEGVAWGVDWIRGRKSTNEQAQA